MADTTNRVGLAGAAALLGLSHRTVQKYASTVYVPGGDIGEPYVPTPDADGTYDPEDWIAWNAARTGRGGRPKGQAPKGQACENCSTVVARRERHPGRTETDPDGERWCLPCLKQADDLPTGFMFRWQRRKDSARLKL